MDKLWAPWRMEYIKAARDDEPGCIFCDFPKQENDKENLIVSRSEHSFVMLNKYPYNNGHLMVIPYAHQSDYTDLGTETLVNMQQMIQMALRALARSMAPHGYNVGLNLGRTAGAGIDAHLHYHIVPRWNGDTNFMPAVSHTKVISESLQSSWQKLKIEFDKLIGK